MTDETQTLGLQGKSHRPFAPCFDYVDVGPSEHPVLLEYARRLEAGQDPVPAAWDMTRRHLNTIARHCCQGRPVAGWWADNGSAALAAVIKGTFDAAR